MEKNQRKRSGGLPMPVALLIIAAVALVVGGLLDRSGLAKLSAEPSAALKNLRISELQNHNVLTLLADDGSAPAWVELENTGGEAIPLHGVCLARDTHINKTFVFPEMTLPAGGCVLVYADGLGRTGADGSLHAGYRLPSSGGSTLYLLDPAQNLLDSVEIVRTAADESMVRGEDGEWTVTAQPTPGDRNGAAAGRGMTVQDGEVELSEIVISNNSLFPDEDGAYSDYVEVHNRTGHSVDLGGYWLSDSAARPNKWQFPGVSLPADGCLAVHCSGADRRDDPAHLHAGFRLSAGETVYLANPAGKLVSMVTLPKLACGQALSLADGGWTTALAPTPNRENTAEAAVQADAANIAARAGGVRISEVMTSPVSEKYDWVELYNAGNADVDLGGYGLSDRLNHARKWQFPAGTVLPARSYTAVFFTGKEGGRTGSYLSAPFALSEDGGYTLSLCDPQGTLIDTLFIPQQYAGVTYGRSDAGDCGYLPASTPLKANGSRALKGPAAGATYSVPGGLYHTGDRFSVTLSAPSGARVYYTLDCSDPDEGATLYDGRPIDVSGTTILRTRVYQDGCLPSVMDTQSYLYDVQAATETPYVVSLVSDPVGLYSDETGIMVKGPNAFQNFPYGDYGRGANFWMDWEREAHLEIYTGDGAPAVSQECGIKLHGRNTRAYELKCFKVMARGRYGGSLFRYPIFRDRPWDDYEAIILRYSGQDFKYTFMRDVLMTGQASNTSVMYMEAEECICYLNGEYYSAMYIRENISPYSLARREGWDGQEDQLDLVKSGYEVKQGSNDSYIALKAWLDSHDNTTQACYDRINAEVDIDNFIEYLTMQIVFGPPDTVNVKRYRNPSADGKWRWVIYDVDRGLREDIDGFALMAQGTNGQLSRACMTNPILRDKLLANLNTALSTYLSSASLLEDARAQFERIRPILPQYLQKMGMTQKQYRSALGGLQWNINKRPGVVLQHCAADLNLSQEEMDRIFAETYAAMNAGAAAPGDAGAAGVSYEDAEGADDDEV